jgi:hypothetical protein
MTLTVHPTDGFINRLLQNSLRATPVRHASGKASEADQMSISQAARQSSAEANPGRNTQLESRLLQMYNNRGDSVD